MGKRGPQPKSSRRHALAGNPSRRAHAGDAAAEPVTKAPPPPAHLSARGKAYWRTLAADLVRRHLLAECDLTALALLCQSWDDYLHSLEDIKEHGATGTTDKGYEYARPCVQMKQQALAAIMRISQRFGLTPQDRIGLAGRDNAPAGDPLNPLESELGKKS